MQDISIQTLQPDKDILAGGVSWQDPVVVVSAEDFCQLFWEEGEVLLCEAQKNQSSYSS